MAPCDQSTYCLSLKSTEELPFMTLKRYANFEEKLTCCLENAMRNLANFHRSARKCQNWNFDRILLPKVENVWPWNLQRSYVSWQWGMIQKCKRTWLVVSKLTWATSKILTRALESLKNLCFNWFLVTNKYLVWAKKVRKSYLLWHWSDVQVLKKTDLWFEKRLEKFGKYHQSTWKCRNWNFDGILLSKVEMVWP